MLTRWLTLSVEDRRLLYRALGVVVRIRLALWFAPVRSLFVVYSQKKGMAYDPERIAWAVAAAARRVPSATCLTQALAAHRLLAQSGHSARIEIGVAKSQPRELEAHAWVSYRARVILGAHDNGRYLRLARWGAEK
jgi:hypothetical protein